MVKRSLGFDLHAAQPSRSRSDSPSALAAVSEDTIGVALMHGSGGLATVARPMVDLGFDLYARRLGTMRIVPIQVKARASLESMQGYQYFNYLLASKDLQRDPSGFLIFTYIPWHRPEAFETVLAIPIPYFVRHCSRVVEDGVEYFAFRWALLGRGRKWVRFSYPLTELHSLWLQQLPAWRGGAAKIQLEVGREVPAPHDHRMVGSLAELFVAEKVQHAGGRNVMVAYDRVRMDCVALLVHDLKKHVVGGLAIHTGSLTKKNNFRVTVRASNFFADDLLWLIVLGHRKDGSYLDWSYVIPSSDVVTLFTKSPTADGGASYTTAVSLGRSKKFDPYKVATSDLGPVILNRVRAAIKYPSEKRFRRHIAA